MTLTNGVFSVNLTPGRNVPEHAQSYGIISMEYALNYNAWQIENARWWYFYQHNAIYVVGNTNIPRNLRQSLHPLS